MKKIPFHTTHKKILADIYMPVGIYLRLRDRFRDTILLESTDSHAAENSYSIIAVNAIAGIEIADTTTIEYKLPARDVQKTGIKPGDDIANGLYDFMLRFEAAPVENGVLSIAQSLFGYAAYDTIPLFEKIIFKEQHKNAVIPLMRYRLYQYVIVINHFKDELYICENHFDGIESESALLEGFIKSKDVPVFPFNTKGDERSNITDDEYKKMVEKGIASCHRGDTFQVVLSRRFQQEFTGDEFNVYRSLRSINPGPYLFYFDYGDYKLMGSSPESQVLINNNVVTVHPIAGTVKRTGDDDTDKALALQLEQDVKENAEHVMLVDLARNDLSKLCEEVVVSAFKKVKYYSHVIHLVSEVKAVLNGEKNPFRIMSATFPAGTLSGAPKYKAMQLIDHIETTPRSFYGGSIGFFGFNGSCNHAIMIRTFLSKNNTLTSQAGAGIVAASKPGNELEEVKNKLRALQHAIEMAKTITN